MSDRLTIIPLVLLFTLGCDNRPDLIHDSTAAPDVLSISNRAYEKGFEHGAVVGAHVVAFRFTNGPITFDDFKRITKEVQSEWLEETLGKEEVR